MIASGGQKFRILRSMGVVWRFNRYLHRLIKAKRAAPQDDLLSALLEAEEAGEKLTEDELVAMVFLLLIAGHETTVNLIGNGTLALLEHPSELARLRREPELMKSAVEELLRFTSPVETATERYAKENVTIAGVTIPRGSLVLAAIASANRDEQHFANPDELDLAREPNKHLAFGLGPHFCFGRTAGAVGSTNCNCGAAGAGRRHSAGRAARKTAMEPRAGFAGAAIAAAGGDVAVRVKIRKNSKQNPIPYPSACPLLQGERVFAYKLGVAFLQEGARDLALRRVENLCWRTAFRHPTLVKHMHGLCCTAGEVHRVGNYDHRLAAGRQIGHHFEHFSRHARVRSASGFVKEHRFGLHGQRPGNRHALLLAAREFVWPYICLFREADAIE